MNTVSMNHEPTHNNSLVVNKVLEQYQLVCAPTCTGNISPTCTRAKEQPAQVQVQVHAAQYFAGVLTSVKREHVRVCSPVYVSCVGLSIKSVRLFNNLYTTATLNTRARRYINTCHMNLDMRREERETGMEKEGSERGGEKEQVSRTGI